MRFSVVYATQKARFLPSIKLNRVMLDCVTEAKGNLFHLRYIFFSKANRKI